MGRVTGDPERLEDYTATTEPIVSEARAALDRYRDAARAFNAAGPNDLGNHVDDLGAPIDAELDLLAELDRAPAAFGFALRHLDRPAGDGLLVGARITDQAWFDALAAARLEHPDAPADEVVVEARVALDTSVILPWEQGGGWRNDPTEPMWWAATPIGATATTVERVWDRWGVSVRGHYRGGSWVHAHGRWRPGWAGRLDPTIGRATTWGRAVPWARGANRVLPVVPGVAQTLADWNDPTLSTGDRIARTGATTLLEGGLGWAGGHGGAVAGAAVGTMIAPGVGTVIGGVAGAVVGGAIGGEVGGFVNDNVQGAAEAAGDGIDAAIEWGGEAVDTVTGFADDLGGAVADGLGSLF